MRSLWYPLFWSKTSGFDYALYAKVLQQAEYFQVEDLREWIYNECFLQAVKVHTSTKTHSKVGSSELFPGNMCTANQQEEFHTSWRIEKEYPCPRNIEIHRGNRLDCVRHCGKYIQEQYGSEYAEIAICSVVSILKEETIDFNVLMPSYRPN